MSDVITTVLLTTSNFTKTLLKRIRNVLVPLNLINITSNREE